jgi:hypothetical protein
MLQIEAPKQHTNVGNYVFKEAQLETFNDWPFDKDSTCNARNVQYKFISFYGLNFVAIARL